MLSRKKQKKSNISAISILICFIVLFSSILYFSFFFNIKSNSDIPHKDIKLKNSAVWGYLNLTNDEIEDTYHPINANLSIEGRLYHIYIPGKDYAGFKVFLRIDGVDKPSYNNITQLNGYFKIQNYSINSSLNVFSAHTFQVIVDNPNDTVEYMNNYTLDINTTSYFDNAQADKSMPYLTGETVDMSGYLRFGNGTGIPNAGIDVYWYTDNMGTLIASSSGSTDPSGEIQDITIPDISNPLMQENITLKLNYSNGQAVGYSEVNISKILVFQNATFEPLSTTLGVAGSQYTVTGVLTSSSPSNFKIFGRTVRVFYNGTPSYDGSSQTLTNGSFSCIFTIPSNHEGSYSYYVDLSNTAGKNIRSTNKYITIDPAPYVPPDIGDPAAPYALFFMIFIPIVVIIGALLSVAGYMFLKKQREEAQVTNIPLEKKIKNLKILKDSNRMEESLSYLFNAIFLTLIDARYGRIKKDHETIRDFAIISVKELKLKPAIIYPFITSVEKIIYSRPFEITDDDFYRAIDVFSPVFYELTGNNFVLNF